MRVLVFSRGDCYTNIIKKTCCNNDFFVVTDAAYTFPTSRFDYYLSSTMDKYATDGYTYFSDEDLFNIVRRDRYLRRLSLGKALDYVYNVTGQLLNIFKNEKPDVIFAHAPDSFAMHIMHKIAIKFDVHAVSLVAYAIPDYFMMFDYNNGRFYRRTNQLEQLDLNKTFLDKAGKKPYYVVKNRGIIKELFYRLRIMLGPMWVRVRFSNPLNPDVRNKNFCAKGYATGAIPLPCLNLGDLNTRKYYASLNSIKNSEGKKIIYISMHYYPEATIDYFSGSTQLIDHDKVIVDILKAFSDRYVFMIKEHPAMYNLRSLKLYKEIKNFTNVYLLHPSTNYVDIVRKSDVVVSWGGSIGLEAPFYGKKTLNIIKPLYHIDGFDNYFLDYNDLMSSFAKKVDHCEYSNESYCSTLYELFSWILFEGDCNNVIGGDEPSLGMVARALDSVFSDFIGHIKTIPGDCIT